LSANRAFATRNPTVDELRAGASRSLSEPHHRQEARVISLTRRPASAEVRPCASGSIRIVAAERSEMEDALARDRAAADVRAFVARSEAGEQVISDAETTALALRAQAGDSSAREQLIERLLPLVSAYARRFPTEGLDQTDLLQEGIVGLLRALDRYEPERGVPFTAFATWWIRRSLQDARSDFIRPFRLPPRALGQLSQLKSEHQRIYQCEQRSAAVAELAERTEIELGQAQALIVADARVRSLDETVDGSDGELGSLGDLLADPLSPEAYENVIDTVAGSQLQALLSRLTEREREIVRARFGFGVKAEKLVEVGQRLVLSAERIRQIEEHALMKLRQSV
jgi:RNA polymerase sigma factor (sigma-70 family)